VVNVRQDIDTLNAFVMDCLRAVYTGKTKIGGLGYDKQGKVGCIARGRGRNVSANRRKTGDTIDGYISLGCMQDALRTSRAAYNTLVRSLDLRNNGFNGLHGLTEAPLTSPKGEGSGQTCNEETIYAPRSQRGDGGESAEASLEAAYTVYKHSIPSEKTMHRTARFYALPESELSDEDMLYGVPREQAERELEQALAEFVYPEDAGWFWQSKNDPDLVVLKSWTTNFAN
jgi:hypothetical protein